MARQLITIDIDKEAGTFSVDTAGFQGTGCSAIHKAFESMGKVTKDVKKPEYYAGPGNGNRLTTGH